MDVVNILLLSDEAIEKNTSRAIFIKVGLASSTFLGLITSVFIFTPLTSTSANETTISSKGSQTFYETDMTEFTGNVKITIPANKATEIRANQSWNVGEISIYEGGVTISQDEMTIHLDTGALFKTKEGFTVTTDYAKLQTHNNTQ